MRALRVWIGTGLLIAISSRIGTAQSSSSISGPSLGFISDAQGETIWPLLGILGAVVPGEPLTLPERITDAAISPQQNYAAAIASDSAQPVIIALDAASPSLARVDGSRPQSKWIGISPTGTAAALYQTDAKLLQLVSGLPAAPRIAYEFDASVLAGDVRSVAVSDDATLALVSVGEESRTLWIVDARGSLSPVRVTRPSHMTFIAGRHDALIADDAAHEAFLLQSLDNNPVRLPGIVLREGVGGFAAVAASSDGRRVFGAQEDSEDITITDLQTRTTVVVPCHCKPTVFALLKGGSLFRLNGVSDGPLTVLDASSPGSAAPRIVIIPLAPDALAGKGREEQ